MDVVKKYWAQGLLAIAFAVLIIVGVVKDATGEAAAGPAMTEGTSALLISSADEIRTNLELSYIQGNIGNSSVGTDLVEEKDGWISAFVKLNIRENASSESEVVGQMTYGLQVVVTSPEINGFYRVTGVDSRSGEEIIGWAASEYVAFEKPEAPYIYLDVPVYRQYDVRWSSVRLGRSKYTIGSAGCTTTCIAMLRSYVKQTTIYPDQMCASLWYDDTNGNLGWPKYLETRGGGSRYEFMISQLQKGLPVMVGGKTSSGKQHWVLVVGYNGDGVKLQASDFMINDPGRDNRTNLKQFFDDFPILYKIAYYVG